jgi:hypothetical protein
MHMPIGLLLEENKTLYQVYDGNFLLGTLSASDKTEAKKVISYNYGYLIDWTVLRAVEIMRS